MKAEGFDEEEDPLSSSIFSIFPWSSSSMAPFPPILLGDDYPLDLDELLAEQHLACFYRCLLKLRCIAE